MNYCPSSMDHLMQPSKSGDSMKCVHCPFQINKQIRWTNHDTGLEVDETRFRIIKEVTEVV